MATIVSYDIGLKQIEFVPAKGQRRRIVRLGSVSMKIAESWKAKIEALVSDNRQSRPHDAEVAQWLAGLDETMLDKLRKVGLADGVGTSQMTLATFLDQYIAGRGDTKPATKTVYGHTRRCLVEFFGEDKFMRDVTPGDADAFRVHLATTEKLADNTVRRRIGIAKQFFRAAIRRKLLTTNPFDGQSTMVRQNPKRFYFVSVEQAQAVLDALPSAQWRLAFALCRYAGCRCPSELLALKWEHVNWEKMRFVVNSPKTEHHESAGIRVVPIFPELYPYFRDAFEAAETGAVFCCPQYAENAGRLYTKMVSAAVARAGLTVWPKLFVNLRSTRETELVERFPVHVVTRWLGNSPNIAAKHYLQVTEAHYDRAASAEPQAQRKAQQKAQQSAAGDDEQEMNSLPETCENMDENDCCLAGATADNAWNNVPLGDTGLGPVTSRV
jgi:integrase